MVDTFDFTDGTSGYVQKQIGGLIISYSAATGSANCNVRYYYNTGTRVTIYRHAEFQFDTSSISDDATITLVEFKVVENIIQGPNPPLSMALCIGSYIGASLDGNSVEWNGGTEMRVDSSYTSGNWYDLAGQGNDPTSYVDVTGTTDIAIKIKLYLSNGTDYTRSFNTAKVKCQLRVTYTVPTSFISRLALLGAGALLGIAVVRSLSEFFVKVGMAEKRVQVFNPLPQIF